MCTTETIYRGVDAYTAIACNYVTGGVKGSCNASTEHVMRYKRDLLRGLITLAEFTHEVDMTLWSLNMGPMPDDSVIDNRIISPNMAYAAELNAMFAEMRGRGEYDGAHNEGGYVETVAY